MKRFSHLLAMTSLSIAIIACGKAPKDQDSEAKLVLAEPGFGLVSPSTSPKSKSCGAIGFGQGCGQTVEEAREEARQADLLNRLRNKPSSYDSVDEARKEAAEADILRRVRDNSPREIYDYKPLTKPSSQASYDGYVYDYGLEDRPMTESERRGIEANKPLKIYEEDRYQRTSDGCTYDRVENKRYCGKFQQERIERGY